MRFGQIEAHHHKDVLGSSHARVKGKAISLAKSRQNGFCTQFTATLVWKVNWKYYEPNKAMSLSRSLFAWCGLTITDMNEMLRMIATDVNIGQCRLVEIMQDLNDVRALSH